MTAPFMQLNVYGPGSRERASNLRSNQIRQFSSIISDILDHNRGRHRCKLLDALTGEVLFDSGRYATDSIWTDDFVALEIWTALQRIEILATHYAKEPWVVAATREVLRVTFASPVSAPARWEDAMVVAILAAKAQGGVA